MDFFKGIAKYVLFVFNLIIVICGIVLITFGGIILANEDKGLKSVTEFSVGGFAIAIGLIIFLIATFGCWGAIKESSCLLITYAAILITLLIIQIVLGILALVALNGENSVSDIMHDFVSRLWNDFVTDPNNPSKLQAIDDIQKSFHCCGVDGWQDYLNTSVMPYVNGVPESCCDGACNALNYFDGCANVLTELVTDNFKVIGGIAIAFAIVELCGAIFAFIVRNG